RPSSLCHLSLPSFPTRRSSDLVVTAGVEYQRPTFLMLQSRYFAEEDGVIAGFERLVTAADQLCDGAAHDRELRKLFERLEPHVKDRKSTRLNSSHVKISYAVFC